MSNGRLEIVKHIPGRFSRGILQCIDIIFKQQIPDLYAIVLFGSCARGEVRSSSDIDIAVVTNTIFTDSVKRGFISGRFEWLDEDLEADVVFADKSTYECGEHMLYEDMRNEGIVLWKGEYTDAYKQLLINSTRRIQVSRAFYENK